jgi:phosphoglycolate phosphatase/pyrophosphatase PpaX
VLDHDDTVVQSTVQLHYPAYLHTLKLLRPRIEPLSCRGFQEACNDPGLVSLYRDEYGLSEEELALELAQWKEFIGNRVPDLFEGMKEVLTAYRNAGGIICVVSHSDRELIERDYQQHFGFVPELVYDLSFPHSKPEPAPIFEILEKTGLGKEQLLVVDDLPLGLQMAQRAGVDFAYAGWCHNPPGIDEQMRNQSPRVFSHPRELLEILL